LLHLVGYLHRCTKMMPGHTYIKFINRWYWHDFVSMAVGRKWSLVMKWLYIVLWES